MLRIIGLLLVLVIVLLGASFAWLNPESVHIDLWVGSVEIRLPYALFFALLFGWLVGILSTAGIIIRLMRKNRRLKRSVSLAETEINNLRNIPIRNVH
jgi:lipopolysaccharide assembly protein A